ncbi:MAG: nucleotidyltransferase family protein [Pseudomonadota bacterium]
MKLDRIALVLLASGLSARFGTDKLMIPFQGRPLLSAAAGALAGSTVAARCAVALPERPERRDLLEATGWTVSDNPDAAQGQSSSLAIGVAQAESSGADGLIILLADMPRVPDSHLTALADAAEDGVPAVMTQADDVLCPPAFFHRSVFRQLKCLEGDRGARHVFQTLDNTRTLALDPRFAIDIDTRADLAAHEEDING